MIGISGPSRGAGKRRCWPVPTDGHGPAVVEWYEVRWQIEIFFRELKSRMQFGGYVLMKFEAVERYLDLLLMGFLLLEQHACATCSRRDLRLPAAVNRGPGADHGSPPVAGGPL